MQEASRSWKEAPGPSPGLARGSAFNAAGQAVPLLVGLACVPFIVRLLGPERFGIVALAWTVAGYFTLFDLGMGRAVTKLGAEAWAAADAATLRGLVRSAQRIQLIFGLAAALLLFILAPTFARVLRAPPELLSETTAAFRILALGIPAILLTTTYRGALEAAQRFDLVNMLRAPLGASMYALTLAGALLFTSVTPLIWLIVSARVLGVFAYAWAYQRAVPAAPHSRGDLMAVGRIVRFGGWVSATSALVPLIGYVDRFLIGALVSLAAVAYYAGPYELATRLLILPGGVAAVLLPALSQHVRRGDAVGLERLYRQALMWCALAAALPATILLFAAEPALRLFLGADYAEQSLNSFRWLLLAAVSNGIALAPFAALEGIGRPDLVTKYHLFELPLYVALLTLAVRLWGIEGAAFLWLARNVWGALTLTLLFRYALRVTGVPAGADARPATPAGPHSTHL